MRRTVKYAPVEHPVCVSTSVSKTHDQQIVLSKMLIVQHLENTVGNGLVDSLLRPHLSKFRILPFTSFSEIKEVAICRQQQGTTHNKHQQLLAISNPHQQSHNHTHLRQPSAMTNRRHQATHRTHKVQRRHNSNTLYHTT